VVAQRLVRRICDGCREPINPPWEAEGYAGLESDWAHGAGCDDCGGSGYRGRTSIAELLPVNDAVRDALERRAGAQDLRRLAREAGMRSMAENGFLKASSGETTPQEVLRIMHD
jgi:type II secretory ATPase GspE/PulE/Tfp pilus assembly ATPase PilB-like protein